MARKVIRTPAVVVGGGLGGVAAAWALARADVKVLLTEPLEWLGGQMTSQAVPPDEHPWIEQFGRTRSYAELRRKIRDHYREFYPLTNESRRSEHLNPGAGLVSPLCHEPRVSAAVIESILSPYVSSGVLTIMKGAVPVAAERSEDQVKSIIIRDSAGVELHVMADYYLDATETGDLLPLTQTPYVTGAESKHETLEPKGAEVAQPANMQSVTWCFAVDHRENESHVIDRPDDYEEWRHYKAEFWPEEHFSLVAPHPHDLQARTHTFNPNPDDDPSSVSADQSANPGSDDLWLFRRILARNHFEPPFLSDVTLVNWPMIDYLDSALIDVSEEEASRHAARAKALSRSFLYWMQTEMPRPDGGKGYPGLRLRPDVMGTVDGFAMAPYHRESRRIVAEYRVTTNDFSVSERGDLGAVEYADSVGVGAYRIDLHPSTQGDNFIDVPAHPFEVPLGALLPLGTRNLIASAKNIGTTHVSSGAYRVHPVEWNIGESAGLLVAFCLSNNLSPSEVRDDKAMLTRFQSELIAEGVEIRWPSVKAW